MMTVLTVSQSGIAKCSLWPPCVAHVDIILLPCGFFFCRLLLFYVS